LLENIIVENKELLNKIERSFESDDVILVKYDCSDNVITELVNEGE